MVASIQLSSNSALATITNAVVNNNTVFQNRAGKYCFAPTQTPITARISNNIFYTSGTAGGSITTNGAVNPSNCLFTGNCYFGTTVTIKWNGTTYAGPAAWRTALPTQEDLSGTASYLLSDPKLVNPGTTVATDYKLQASSPMLGAGLDLNARFGIAMGAIDYFGAATVAPYNVGAGGT
jgi:hypothetical protein